MTAAAHAVPTHETGVFVWVRWGNTRGVQLGQVINGQAAVYFGEAFYRVRVFSKKHGRWNEGTTERRILRALTGAEIRKYIAAGVISERKEPVSEKEQAQAIRLLAEWLAQASLDTPAELRRKTEEFLSLSEPEPPQSHGQRRS